jgi:hypothetical protein
VLQHLRSGSTTAMAKLKKWVFSLHFVLFLSSFLFWNSLIIRIISHQCVCLYYHITRVLNYHILFLLLVAESIRVIGEHQMVI